MPRRRGGGGNRQDLRRAQAQPDGGQLTAGVEVLLAGPRDAGRFDRIADDVFDHAVDPEWLSAFLADPHQHIAIALSGDTLVGMASGVTYHHPDKPREMFLNEVGVAPSHRRRGIASALLRTLLAEAGRLACREAWVLTEADNAPARALYAALGGTESGIDPVMFAFSIEAP